MKNPKILRTSYLEAPYHLIFGHQHLLSIFKKYSVPDVKHWQARPSPYRLVGVDLDIGVDPQDDLGCFATLNHKLRLPVLNEQNLNIFPYKLSELNYL